MIEGLNIKTASAMSPRNHGARRRIAEIMGEAARPRSPCETASTDLFANTCVLSSLHQHRLGLGNIPIRGKIIDGDGFWHRMGDVGYLDAQQRLWFCGRRGHRVCLEDMTLFTIPCEAVFNVHPKIARTALVGIGSKGHQEPVLIIEPLHNKEYDTQTLIAEARELGQASELTKMITHYLIHPDFPVDIRHNAKIFREKLSLWAEGQLAGKR